MDLLHQWGCPCNSTVLNVALEHKRLDAAKKILGWGYPLDSIKSVGTFWFFAKSRLYVVSTSMYMHTYIRFLLHYTMMLMHPSLNIHAHNTAMSGSVELLNVALMSGLTMDPSGSTFLAAVRSSSIEAVKFLTDHKCPGYVFVSNHNQTHIRMHHHLMLFDKLIRNEYIPLFHADLMSDA